MTRTHLTSAETRPWLDRWWSPAVIWLLLMIVHYSHLARPFENLAIRAVLPIQSSTYQHSMALITTRTGTASPAELQKQVQDLQNQVRQLTIDNAHLQTIAKETTLLKKQQDFLEKQSYQALPAKVVSRSTDGLSRTVIINQGSRDGLIVGLPVIVDNGVLIGTITETADYWSQVRLVTSLDSNVSGMINNEVNSPGIVRGAYNVALEMSLIPQTDSVTIGQTVVTSGSDRLIPSGLIIGTVQAVTNDPAAVFRTAQLESLYDINTISVVSVLLQ